ncbi:MAG: sigma-54-dependent Fis family transcriptional regulator [Rhodocyclaceae bacterium]
MGLHQLAATLHGQKLQQARQQFFERGESPAGLLKAPILRSWQRCRRFGLAENRGLPEIDFLGPLALKSEHERNAHWLPHGRSVMAQVHAQIRDSGSMLVLADANGLLLETLGDASFAGRADCLALAAGASWDENRCGTNAIGTALDEEASTEVLGGEHYFEQHAFLAGCASPIFAPDGKLIGIFNIAGDYHGDERHTLGLAVLSAAIIENRLFEATHARDLLVCFQSRAQGLGHVGEGLAAISPDGQVLAINRAGLDILGIRRIDAIRRDFAIVFESRLAPLIDRLRGNPLASHELSVNGRQVQVQLRGQLPLRAIVGHGDAEATIPCNRRRADNRRTPEITFDTLVSDDGRMQAAIDRARRILGRDIPILIQGESGAGKEMFARGFHNSGPRRAGPFVALNCAAIPETLIESELFGYQGGAYTGARKEGALGKIQQAHGGTLFLDEIGDMPFSLQARLLRVLQERCVTPLGSNRTVAVDISLVCATHHRLKEEVARQRFREDLYYRLNGLCVTLPALRERSDIRQLVQKLADAESVPGRFVSFSEGALQAVERYAWPGNIRQLFNVVRVAIALLDDGETLITERHLPEELFDTAPNPAAAGVVPAPAANPWAASAPDCADSLDQIERQVTRRTLDAAGGNISAAARQLGISRGTLYRILAKSPPQTPGKPAKLERP